jgi:L-asparaginase II
MPLSVDAIRGGTVESRHRVSAAVVDPDGTLVGWSGDPELVTFWRSCAKPFQVLPLIRDGGADALGITDEEITVACASHSGEPRHLAVVAGLLEKAGCTEDDLACGPHPSLSPAVARAMAERGEKPRRLHSNCSGKHAGMLAQARFAGWPIADYRGLEHPVQRGILAEVSRWTGFPAERIATGVDGCGVVSFALPLRNMALAYARLGSGGLGIRGWGVGPPPANRQSPTPAQRLLRAITSHPFLIAGTGRLCTEIISSSGGRIIAKVGADGVYCAAIPEARLGLAMKVEDGDVDSARPALVALLDVLAPGVAQVAEVFRTPPIRNTLGEEVGRLEVRIALERAP